MRIDIANEFSPVPSGRFLKDGNDSGERFREGLLLKAIKEGGPIIIKLDGTAGYHSSFLEEAFGGAVRKGYISSSDFLSRLVLEYEDKEFEMFKDMIEFFIKDAKRS
jgi:hypothetical protein